jgi:threonine dehydratase
VRRDIVEPALSILMTISLAAIEQARQRLQSIIKPTPLMPSATLSRMLEAEVLLKLENLQRTGSFKIRGAYNRVANLSSDESAHGVIAASAGNHGQALAYAATRAGVKATIVMPRTAAIAKIDATRSYGQPVILEGANYQEARAGAWALSQRSGALFVDA